LAERFTVLIPILGTRSAATLLAVGGALLRRREGRGTEIDVAAVEVGDGRDLSAGPLIDRDAIWARKREVLMRIFLAHGGGEAFGRWREEQGRELQEWATWAALADQHGADWHAWPPELRRPDAPEVASFAEYDFVVVNDDLDLF